MTPRRRAPSPPSTTRRRSPASPRAVDIVTFEFENVPTATVEFLAERVPVRPGARALALTQDRLTEKTFLRDLGLKVAPFVERRGCGRAGARGRRARPPVDPQDPAVRL